MKKTNYIAKPFRWSGNVKRLRFLLGVKKQVRMEKYALVVMIALALLSGFAN
jgi:hypothetical protein